MLERKKNHTLGKKFFFSSKKLTSGEKKKLTSGKEELKSKFSICVSQIFLLEFSINNMLPVFNDFKQNSRLIIN